MKTHLLGIAFFYFISVGVNAQNTQNMFLNLYLYYDGSISIAQDPDYSYLGKITNEYDSDSIFNDYGTYGNKFSSKSIWNKFSTFGNKFSSYSPFNEYSYNPPMIIKDRTIIGYLSVNGSLEGAISPYLLKVIFE